MTTHVFSIRVTKTSFMHYHSADFVHNCAHIAISHNVPNVMTLLN